MRLEVFCKDRLGLTRELLDLLVLRSIDLRGIEIDPIGKIYLNFAEIEFDTFSSLMAEIRRIAGVTDVRTVPWMPSEREHLALSALLEAMPEPFLSLDLRSKIERANLASCQLFGLEAAKLANHTAPQLIPGFNFQRWLESNPQSTHSEHVVIHGQNFLMENNKCDHSVKKLPSSMKRWLPAALKPRCARRFRRWTTKPVNVLFPAT
jgi:transcriptional regulator of aroF, aroG, tyrA and aromatic amino acid transport